VGTVFFVCPIFLCHAGLLSLCQRWEELEDGTLQLGFAWCLYKNTNSEFDGIHRGVTHLNSFPILEGLFKPKMATNAGALSHLVEAASALAEMQPGKKVATHAPSSSQHAPAVVKDYDTNNSTEDSTRNKREIFPERLMSILNDASLSDIITWLPHGRSFVIIRPDVFAEKVMPTYFPSPDARCSTKYPSFTRKLNRW